MKKVRRLRSKLTESAKIASREIIQKGNEIIFTAEYYFDEEPTVCQKVTGKAICQGSDKFDFNVGKRIAILKAFKKINDKHFRILVREMVAIRRKAYMDDYKMDVIEGILRSC